MDLQLTSDFFLVLLISYLPPLEERVLVRMCNQSPAKILRSVKRMTSFLERKRAFPMLVPAVKLQPTLSIQHLPVIDIPPLPPKLLSSQKLQPISILPKPKKLSVRKFFPIETVPGSRWEDDVWFSSYINGGSHTTTFVCHICNDDFTFKSADTIRNHIQSAHRQEMYYRLKNDLNSQPKLEEFG